MYKYFLIVLLLLPSLSLAKPDNDVLLKPANYKELEDKIHQELIDKIDVKNHVYQVINGQHSHPAIPGCTKAVKHSHKARKKHYHKYSCRGLRRYSRAIAKRRGAKASITNVQEQGVDEADLVKTDGRYLYAVQPNGNSGIRVYDTQYKGKQLKQISAIGFGKNIYIQNIYLLAGQKKLIAIAGVRKKGRSWWSNSNKISIITVDIRHPAKPRTIKQAFVDGRIKSTRRINNMLYVVMSKQVDLPTTYKMIETTQRLSKKRMEQERQKIITEIKKWRIKSQLSVYREQGKGKSQAFIQEGSLYYNPANKDIHGITAILAIDLNKKNTTVKSMAWLGTDYGIHYFSKKAVYITSTDYQNINTKKFPVNATKTLIHKFSYQRNDFDYRGSGYVLGQIGWGWNGNDSFRLDEDKKGNLRVVSNNPQAAYFVKKRVADPALRSPVIFSSLAEDPRKKALVTLDSLPNRKYPKALGKPGEQLYGARLFDDYAYFVTFRRTDPLYVIDLRQPRHLKKVGELVIPGFSDYLHPLGDGLLLGVGSDTTVVNGRIKMKGAKISLFDIHNPRHPREIDQFVLSSEWSNSEVTNNRHAFTFLRMNSRTTRIALPIQSYGKSGYNKFLHRFEIDRIKREISYLGGMKAVNTGWSSNDRSIMIGDRLYYYHNGHFTVGNWKDKAVSIKP
ncbi:MAG: beta-propeller domain-containing protein [Thiotrichaceae bacterium]|nr:beta-propeller domain-containing protein [Thiotrichaceae bacterium]